MVCNLGRSKTEILADYITSKAAVMSETRVKSTIQSFASKSQYRT